MLMHVLHILASFFFFLNSVSDSYTTLFSYSEIYLIGHRARKKDKKRKKSLPKQLAHLICRRYEHMPSQYTVA
jgi:hypothetical protein